MPSSKTIMEMDVTVQVIIHITIVVKNLTANATQMLKKKQQNKSSKKQIKNMSRKSRFLVGLAAALLTFGGLFATMGPKQFNSCRPCHRMDHGCMHEEHFRHCDESTKTIKAEKVIIIREVAKTDSVKN